MHYPIAIEIGDEAHTFGVAVPDLPGCFSAGDTLDEAMINAKEAVVGWIETMLDRGEAIPQPSPIEALRADHPEFKDWIWAVVHIDPAMLDDKVERVNITLPRRVLYRLDAAARAAGESRSGFIARMALS